MNEPLDLQNGQDSPAPLPLRDIIIGGIGFLLFLSVLILGMNAIGVETLQNFIQSAGIFAPLIYIALKAFTYVFAPLTSGPIQILAGTLFDSVWLGVLYTLIGEVLGGSISFWIARKYGQPLVRRFVGAKGLAQIEAVYEKQLGGWLALALARVVLFSLWDFISYAAGLANTIRFRTYFLISVILGAIPTFFFVWLGTTAIEDSSSLWWVYGLVIVLIALPLVGNRLLSRVLKSSVKGGA